MRNLKKILIMICVLALLTAGCVVVALATDGDGDETNVGSVAELSKLVTQAETATDADTKRECIVKVANYLETKEMDPSEEGYADSIVRINATAVECASLYLSEIPEDITADGVDVDAALDSFMYADEMLHIFDLHSGAVGFSAVKPIYDSALVRIASALVSEIGTDIENEEKPKTAQNKAKLNKANRIISYCTPYGDEDILAEARTKFEECVAAHNAAVEKNLAALDAKNDVSNYDLPFYYEQDWENSKVGYVNGPLEGWHVVFNKADDNKMGIREEPNGNKYYVHEYHEKETPDGSYMQYSLQNFDSADGIVFEFDIATFGEIPKEGIVVETGSINGNFPPCYFAINGNGDICSNDKKTVVLEGAFTRGGWIHIIIALDPEEFVYNLYVEGQYVTTYNARFDDGTTFNHAAVSLRLSGGPSTQGEVAYDNFKIYAGDNYRSQDRLANMTDEERFIYYVNTFSDDTFEVLERTGAYERARDFIHLYRVITNEETNEYEYTDLIKDDSSSEDGLSAEIKAQMRTAVDNYMSFDVEGLLHAAKTENLKLYVNMVIELARIERSVESVSARNKAIETITGFLKKNATLIDLEADYYDSNATGEEANMPNGAYDYDEYNMIYNSIVKQVEYDTNAPTFVKYMDRFKNATTLSAAERYYEYAKQLITGDSVDIGMAEDETTPGRENFMDFVEAYEIYLGAHEKVDEVTKENNSHKIVQCINVIIIYRTEEEWKANEELMMEYLTIVEDVILGRDENGDPLYNTSYEGVDEAVRFFNRAYGYFYEEIQREHIEYIAYILERISATEDYVEKIGLVALIDRYIDTNDVDYENEQIIKLLDNLDTCKSELELRSEDYSKVLEQNSGYFINYVEKMRTATSYTEQIANFEAAALLYFSLDTAVEGTLNAIQIYDEYNEKLRVIEESSVKFMEAVSIYNACETADEKYAALVECYYNAQFAELTYPGVEEAMAEYKVAYDAHVGYANAVNAEVVDTVNAVASFRANSGVLNIIAIIIKKIFGI